jgi:hypothetical protein
MVDSGCVGSGGVFEWLQLRTDERVKVRATSAADGRASLGRRECRRPRNIMAVDLSVLGEQNNCWEQLRCNVSPDGN